MDLWGAPLVASDIAHGLQIPFTVLLSEVWLDTGAAISHRLMVASKETYLGGAAIRGTYHQWIAESTYFGPSSLLRKICILGPGKLKRTHDATTSVVQSMIGALLDSSAAPQLQETIDAADAEVVIQLASGGCAEEPTPVSDDVRTYDCHVSKGWDP